MNDNVLPIVGTLLQRSYNDDRRAWTLAACSVIPTMKPWPKRRTKRRPIPGVIDAPTDSEG